MFLFDKPNKCDPRDQSDEMLVEPRSAVFNRRWVIFNRRWGTGERDVKRFVLRPFIPAIQLCIKLFRHGLHRKCLCRVVDAHVFERGQLCQALGGCANAITRAAEIRIPLYRCRLFGRTVLFDIAKPPRSPLGILVVNHHPRPIVDI